MSVKRVLGAAVAAGAASLALATAASADVIQMAPHQLTWTTADGWNVTLANNKESVNRVPPLDTTGTTREAFLSDSASVRLGGHGSSPLQGGVLETGYQIGCAAGLGPVSLGIAPTLGLGGGVNFGANGLPVPGANLGPSLSIAPSISTTLKPGEVKEVPLGKKKIEGPVTGITVRNVHLHIDGCVGPVTMRSYTKVAVSTAANDDQNAVYGDPLAL